MRKNSIVKTTTDSRVYRITRYLVIVESREGCTYCSPHKGCNRFLRLESRSWKDTSKREYQWEK
jgi:hypothetical protein